MGLAEPEYNKLITCMSASKTFNMAGLMFSDIIIRNEEERERFKERDKIVGFVNPLSVAAHKAAYEKRRTVVDGIKRISGSEFCLCESVSRSEFPGSEISDSGKQLILRGLIWDVVCRRLRISRISLPIKRVFYWKEEMIFL